jgi:hypothetical protein
MHLRFPNSATASRDAQARNWAYALILTGILIVLTAYVRLLAIFATGAVALPVLAAVMGLIVAALGFAACCAQDRCRLRPHSFNSDTKDAMPRGAVAANEARWQPQLPNAALDAQFGVLRRRFDLPSSN